MKKIILIILTALVSLFIFNYNVEALNSDATATCVYKIPGSNVFNSFTYEYANVDGSYNCSVPPTTSSNVYICEVDSGLTKEKFVNNKTDELLCPILYYSYGIKSSLAIEGSPSITTHSFAISFKDYNENLSWFQKIFDGKTVYGAMNLSFSSIKQGSQKIEEENESKYLQCICGDILLKQGSLTFNNQYSQYSQETDFTSFNLNNFTKCPEAIYYKFNDAFLSGNRYMDIRDTNFDKAQSAACATTEDADAWDGSSGNDTDYKPQEDVIKSFCEETHGVWKMAGYLINALKVMIPVIIIVMGSIDLGKAVVANSEDEMKKATQVLIKRVIAGIIIFFIPTIMNLILKMASNYVSTISSSSSCVECVTKPWGC